MTACDDVPNDESVDYFVPAGSCFSDRARDGTYCLAVVRVVIVFGGIESEVVSPVEF